MSTLNFLILVAGAVAMIAAGIIMWGWPMALLVGGITAVIAAISNS